MQKAPFAAFGLIAAGLFAASIATASAFDLTSITLKVGYGAGGTFDLSSRLVARHIGKFLPGNPSIVVQNEPGGGSLKLTKLMLGSEPTDGSVIGSIGPAMAFAPILDPENADYDASAIVWLGSLSNEPAFCVTTKASGIDTMEKFLGTEFHIGASGKNSATYQQAAIPLNGLDAKFNIVTGFDGVAEIELAMERNEIAGQCSASVTDLKRRGMLDGVNIIGRLGSGTAAGFEDVPRFSSMISDPTVRKGAELLEAVRDVNYPLMVPGGTPQEIVDVLRGAYAAMIVDPDFIADVEAIGEFQYAPTPGARMAEIVSGHLQSDPAVLDAAKALVQ
jgi:tripartite-type tricarboxylate transporter receptor subunit TctC